MIIDGEAYRTIWPGEDGQSVEIIDQTLLPHRFEIVRMYTPEQAAHAISSMQVRGAPLIGATAAYGMALAMLVAPTDAVLENAAAMLLATRPTAMNLRWALQHMDEILRPLPEDERVKAAFSAAAAICDEDVETCRMIGVHGLDLIKEVAGSKGGGVVNVLTHCNAGWLATVDWGTALSPIFHGHNAGIGVHVWVDETRPRNQGASLTAYELTSHGVPHHVIVDNAGGHLMQHGLVDMCIVGTDRTAANGDVANKIGTYLKALAAKDNDVPFYVALPSPTIDWDCMDGMTIPIEQRDAEEVTHIPGALNDGSTTTVRLTPAGSPARNDAFDVTPARLVTGLITERGVCTASHEGLLSLFPERRKAG